MAAFAAATFEFSVLTTVVFMVSTGFTLDDRIKKQTLEKNGATTVRVWAGQDYGAPDMGGHVPDFATFNYDGQMIGYFRGGGKRIAAGGFVDILVHNKPRYAHVEPWYLRMFAGGDDGLCVPSLAIEGPVGHGMMFWPELLIACNHKMINELHYDGKTRPGYTDSQNLIGKNGERPKCVWFDRNFSYGLKMSELTIHLPDLLMHEEKAKEWRENKELFCKPTPRLLPAEVHAWEHALTAPVWVFNPPLKYNYTNGLEMDTSQVLNWKHDNTVDQLGTGGWSSHFNRDVFVHKITDLEGNHPAGARSRDLQADDHEESSFNKQSADTGNRGIFHRVVSGLRSLLRREVDPLHEEENLAMYNDARRLIVLNTSTADGDSATSRCTLRNTDKSDNKIKRDPKENPDYLSLDEKVYCDSLMTTMFSTCEDKNSTLCFDQDLMMLRRFEAEPDPMWQDHDAAILEGSKSHKKRLRRKRAVEAVGKVEEDNRQAEAQGIPIKYRLGEPRPLWNRPYHPTRVTLVDSRK